MLVFVDESGDPGMKGKPGSSKYFIVTAVVFTDNDEALKCEESICRVRSSLGLHERYEFHFNKCNQAIRERFLETVVGRKFFYHSMVMNKRLLWSKRFYDTGEFYRFTAGIVFENAEAKLNEAIVVIDKCGDRGFKTALIKHLKQAANKNGNKIKHVKMQESHANDLLQLADMVCGAVAKSLNDTGPKGWKYRRIIVSKEARVQLWPT
jgi:hypothetical protein